MTRNLPNERSLRFSDFLKYFRCAVKSIRSYLLNRFFPIFEFTIHCLELLEHIFLTIFCLILGRARCVNTFCLIHCLRNRALFRKSRSSCGSFKQRISRSTTQPSHLCIMRGKLRAKRYTNCAVFINFRKCVLDRKIQRSGVNLCCDKKKFVAAEIHPRLKSLRCLLISIAAHR